MTITAAADGSALGNPGPAGWAWYVDDDHWAAGGWPHSTNNRGELTAVLELFRATESSGEDLLILCDSQYVINSITKWMPGWKARGWRKNGGPIMNLDLMQEIDEAIAGRRYRFEWIKGHAGHPLNEAADVRARAAAEAYQRGSAVPGGPGFGSAPRDEAEALAIPEVPDDTAEPDEPAEPDEAAEPDETTLFDLEPEFSELTVTLTAAEHAHVIATARELGVSVEEFVRSRLR